MKKITMTLACLALLCGSSFAQQHQVNISGATLFADFFTAPASTNDYIDVDSDGIFGFDSQTYTVDQLALDNYNSSSSWWVVMYRGVGSGNGLAEMVNYYNTTPAFGDPTDTGQINRTFWYDVTSGGPIAGVYNAANPGGAPIMPNNVDIGVMDVPTTWFVTKGSSVDSEWDALPATDGYGMNPVVGWDAGARSNKLKSLGGLNTNTSSPDALTVFDTQIAWVPISFIANAGTGVENVTQDELKHLFITGRMPNGENLAAATRDSGSGTRNGAMSTMGVDPSWGRGDNYGAKVDQSQYYTVGANYQVSNLGGSSVMEGAVQNGRLALGYTGLFGSSRSAVDASSGKYEIVNLKKDGQDVFVRPSLGSVFYNIDPNGWQIGGPETFATVGNPAGGAFPMANSHAADYINNILTSIDDFISSPGLDENYNMPGEYMAYNYTLMNSISYLPDPLNPSDFQLNTNLNTNLQTFSYNGNVLEVPAFGSVNPAGKVPTRVVLTGGATYSDGSTGAYFDGDGSAISGGNLAARNRISGDFNNDGVRNINDISNLMAAVADPRGFAAAEGDNGGAAGDQAGDYVIPEVIGDFDGDGNFDAADVRYFADGLAIQAGKLNRAAGFVAVDAAFGGNYFGTTLATSAAYTYGASMADVAGNDAAPGAMPLGSDGMVDADDIDYVYASLRQQMKIDLVGGSVVVPVRGQVRDFADKDTAVWMDLSCDMNGDLMISKADVDAIVLNVLGTVYGDVDLDGDFDAADEAVINANLGTAGGWAAGDVDGDGMVTAADLDLANGIEAVSADINGDGSVDMADFALLAEQWLN